MSLQCRSCGEKLPLVPLTDAAADPADVPPSAESIWKTEAPNAMIGRGDDDAVVTVHGDNAPAPVRESAHETAPESAPILEPIAAPRLEPVSATVPDVEPAPIELPAPATVTKKKKNATVIERLHASQTELESPLRQAPPPKAAVAESFAEPVETELNAESASEIEVSTEAETLVEASVAPVTYALPDEIAINETAQIDGIASQLRESAWRTAMPLGPSASMALALALIHTHRPHIRRISMHRVGLIVAAAGAIAAVVYSVGLAPGTSPVATQAAAPGMQPAPITGGNTSDTYTLAPAAGAVAAAMPVTGLARSAESAAPAAAVAPAAERPREKPATVAATVTMPAETPATTIKPALARRSVPAPAATIEHAAPPAAQARRKLVETPRPCTSTVAALGLCTPEASQEGK